MSQIHICYFQASTQVLHNEPDSRRLKRSIKSISLFYLCYNIWEDLHFSSVSCLSTSPTICREDKQLANKKKIHQVPSVCVEISFMYYSLTISYLTGTQRGKGEKKNHSFHIVCCQFLTCSTKQLSQLKVFSTLAHWWKLLVSVC